MELCSEWLRVNADTESGLRFYLFTWFIFTKAWPGGEASWYWNKASLESSKEVKWNKGDVNAVHLLIHLNRFSLLSESIYQKNKAKNEREKLSLEADFLQAVKSYAIYNIIVFISSKDIFFSHGFQQKRTASMRNQTNKTNVSSHN